MSEKLAEDVCYTCQQPLHDSVIIEKDDEVFKSCPSCSNLTEQAQIFSII